MERFPAWLIILVFLGIIVFNFLMQRAARRRQQEEQAQAQPAPPPVEEEVLEDIWGRTPTPALAPTPPPPVLAARPAVPP
ncbi:MAG TPA: hypothetical protein VJ789_08055, partial [Burkholderiales bacterium]|nr:hypothetical protein [Burkholderiales bacterium]